MKHLKMFEQYISEEVSYRGGIDPAMLVKALSGEKVDEGQFKGKDLFLDDLINTDEGREILSGKFKNLAEMLKKFGTKINLLKAEIDHPNVLAQVNNTLIKAGLLTFDQLKAQPKIVDPASLKSADWGDEVLAKLDQDTKTKAMMLKAEK